MFFFPLLWFSCSSAYQHINYDYYTNRKNSFILSLTSFFHREVRPTSPNNLNYKFVFYFFHSLFIIVVPIINTGSLATPPLLYKRFITYTFNEKPIFFYFFRKLCLIFHSLNSTGQPKKNVSLFNLYYIHRNVVVKQP